MEYYLLLSYSTQSKEYALKDQVLHFVKILNSLSKYHHHKQQSV